MFLPHGVVSPHETRALKARLTAKLGGSDVPAEDRPRLPYYRTTESGLLVPRQFGIEWCRKHGVEYEDATSNGRPVKFPKTPEPRDYQVPVLDDLFLKTQSYYDFVFRARTGFGKTISSLILASRLGRSTCVLVDQENLLQQWMEAAEQHFGLKQKDIGVIQGSRFDEGKILTIAMVQTMAQRDYGEEELSQFGLLLVDECHVVGAPTFSKCLLDFPCSYRLGISATPTRRDGLQKVLEDNLGPILVYVADAHKKSSVYVASNPTVYSWYANSSPKSGRYITEIAEDAARNLRIVELAKMLYDSGRDTVVMGDRTEHLQSLMDLAIYCGVPEEDVGLYTGSHVTYAIAKDPLPDAAPIGASPGVKYSPVALQALAKKSKKAVLDAVKANARIIFATYAKFAKGVDVPRLTGGVEATPRAQAEQMHGRILRQASGSMPAIWITILDYKNYRSLHQLAGRIKDYTVNNADLFVISDSQEIVPWQNEELTRLLRRQSRELEKALIEPGKDGLNTLKFLSTPIPLGLHSENGTAQMPLPGFLPRPLSVASSGRLSTASMKLRPRLKRSLSQSLPKQ